MSTTPTKLELPWRTPGWPSESALPLLPLLPDETNPTPTALPGDKAAPPPAEGIPAAAVVQAIPLRLIEPDPFQPRQEANPEAIARLAMSLESHGQLQPIVVRPGRAPGRFMIVAGARRWTAAMAAGHATIQAIVLDAPVDRPRALELQLVENLLREDLNPIDQAEAFHRLMDGRRWSAARLARALHLSESRVSRALALLALPDEVRVEVAAGRVAPSVALELGRVPDPARRGLLTARAAAEGLTRAQVSGETARPRRPKRASGRAPRSMPVERMVFEVVGGRVIVELSPPGGKEAALDAVTEASEIIQDELDAEVS
jgi:ParB family chromosome partitioning protein